jgi:hypothetical protein
MCGHIKRWDRDPINIDLICELILWVVVAFRLTFERPMPVTLRQPDGLVLRDVRSCAARCRRGPAYVRHATLDVGSQMTTLDRISTTLINLS